MWYKHTVLDFKNFRSHPGPLFQNSQYSYSSFSDIWAFGNIFGLGIIRYNIEITSIVNANALCIWNSRSNPKPTILNLFPIKYYFMNTMIISMKSGNIRMIGDSKIRLNLRKTLQKNLHRGQGLFRGPVRRKRSISSGRIRSLRIIPYNNA